MCVCPSACVGAVQPRRGAGWALRSCPAATRGLCAHVCRARRLSACWGLSAAAVADAWATRRPRCQLCLSHPPWRPPGERGVRACVRVCAGVCARVRACVRGSWPFLPGLAFAGGPHAEMLYWSRAPRPITPLRFFLFSRTRPLVHVPPPSSPHAVPPPRPTPPRASSRLCCSASAAATRVLSPAAAAPAPPTGGNDTHWHQSTATHTSAPTTDGHRRGPIDRSPGPLTNKVSRSKSRPYHKHPLLTLPAEAEAEVEVEAHHRLSPTKNYAIVPTGP